MISELGDRVAEPLLETLVMVCSLRPHRELNFLGKPVPDHPDTWGCRVRSGRVGAGACTIVSQRAHASLIRTWRITLKRTGSSSSISQTSSPRTLSSPEHCGQADSCGTIVCVSRTRCSGNSRRGLEMRDAGVDPVRSAKMLLRCASSVSSSSTQSSNCPISRSRFSLRLPDCKRRNLIICALAIRCVPCTKESLRAARVATPSVP